MGAIHFPIDVRLVRVLVDALGLTTFVETGTFRGESIGLVKDLFSRVHSVEASEALVVDARRAFADESHVQLVHGDSPDFLRANRAEIAGEACLYWLDAHWCGPVEVNGAAEECPLLEEIAAIGALNRQSVIIIDDARLFLSPPPPPHDATAWPAFDLVLRSLRSVSENHQVMVLNDEILFYPPDASEAVHAYARRESFDLLQVMNYVRAANLADLNEELVAKEEIIQKLAADLDRLRSSQQKLGGLHEQLVAKEAVVQKLAAALDRLRLTSQEKLDVLREQLVAKEAVIQKLAVALDRLRSTSQPIAPNRDPEVPPTAPSVTR